MSPKLKQLSGPEVVAALKSAGFDTQSQKGSHIKLKRFTQNTGQKQTLTIPNHKSLAIGTLRAIVRQASKYLSDKEIEQIFYQ